MRKSDISEDQISLAVDYNEIREVLVLFLHNLSWAWYAVQRNDAKIFRFCRAKCHKNFKMKRNPRKVKWTKAYRRLHGKDMTQDSTFEFERKRNRPERYDRNLAANTLGAIKKIDKVRSDRERNHIENRKKVRGPKEIKEAHKEIEQGIHMIEAPAAIRLGESKIKVKVSQQQAEENRAMEE